MGVPHFLLDLRAFHYGGIPLRLKMGEWLSGIFKLCLFTYIEYEQVNNLNINF